MFICILLVSWFYLVEKVVVVFLLMVLVGFGSIWMGSCFGGVFFTWSGLSCAIADMRKNFEI
jgi:hypothetical protein